MNAIKADQNVFNECDVTSTMGIGCQRLDMIDCNNRWTCIEGVWISVKGLTNVV